MATQAMLFGVAGSCVAGAIGAAWRERRRMRRSDPDAVGPVDWRTVQLAAIGAAIILAGMALRLGGAGAPQ